MLTFSNITADTFESGSQRGKGRKRPRHREAISCWQCRNRKIRCDRKLPCQQCQTRGLPLGCCYSLSRDPSTFRIQKSETPRNNIRTATSSYSSSSSRETSSPKEASTPPTAAPSVSSECSNRSHSTRIPFGSSGAGSETNEAVRQSPHQSLCSRRNVKTRLIGRTHWKMPCNDLIVLKAMLEKTDQFGDCQKQFRELKSRVRVANAIPSSISTMIIDGSSLPSLLPDRKTCEDRIAEYSQTYGQIYDFVDAKSLTDALNTIYSSPADTNPVDVCKLILVIAIAMQSDEAERLNARKLARYVEDCYHSSSWFQKPCIGTVQALLLLVIIEMIASSDTNKMYGMLSILGLTSQAAYSISLHRDPVLFGVTPYHAEVRKRLWACFFRLNLDYCIRSGTSLALRLEDIDCPLPSAVNINTLNTVARKTNNAAETVEPSKSDPTFGIAAAKLAMIIAPVQQAICSTSKTISVDLQKHVREAFKALKVTMPSYLQPGANTMDPIQEIQQSLITATMNTVMLIISSHFVMGVPSDVSQRSNLLDTWDNAISILHLFQNLSQHTPQTQDLAYQLLWSDTCRAAFTASMVLGRLRNIESDSTMSTKPQHTLSTFHESLVGYLAHLSHFWLTKSHQGSIAAKICLLFGVLQAVTSHLLIDFNSPRVVDKLLGVGVAAAEHTVAEMKQAMQRRSYHLAFTNPSVGTCSNSSATASTLPTPDSRMDSFWANPGMVFDERHLADPHAQMSNAQCEDIMGGVDFASFAEDLVMPLPSVEPSPALNDADTFARWVEEVGF